MTRAWDIILRDVRRWRPSMTWWNLEDHVRRFLYSQYKNGNTTVIIVIVCFLVVLFVLAWAGRRDELYDILVGERQPTVTFKGEELVRSVFQERFGAAFPKSRGQLHWLRNPRTGRSLELDGYSHALHMAFEFDGAQHFHYTPGFHKTRENFKRMQERDQTKDRLCKENGILLVRIPYWVLDAAVEGPSLGDVKDPRIRLIRYLDGVEALQKKKKTTTGRSPDGKR